MIDAVLTNSVLPRISTEYLTRLAGGSPLKGIRLGARDNDFAFDFN
jgi:type VI secretion system protein VasG